MEVDKTIKKYLKCLEDSDYESMIKLFSEDAVVHSPLYGEIKADKFYKDLFKDTSNSDITLMNIFKSQNNSNSAAGHFRYDWVLEDGTPTSFECVDILKFNDNGEIKELIIIYDTSDVRNSFEEMKE